MTRQFKYLVLLMITFATGLKSQYYFYNDKYYHSPLLVETGISIGGMNCLTDLGGRSDEGSLFVKDINWNQTHPCMGLYVGVLFDQLLGVRLEANFGKISGADKVLKRDQPSAKDRYQRNLHFQSTISELALLVEFFPFSLLNKESYPLIAPYLIGGIGFFKFNPQAELGGQWINLHPLHTEGQGFSEYSDKAEYRLTQVEFPIGFGLRYELSALWNLRLELIYRFLNTDYLDDVSTKYINPASFHANLHPIQAMNAQMLADRSYELQPALYRSDGDIRGNPEKKDGYFSCSLQVGFTINRKRR